MTAPLLECTNRFGWRFMMPNTTVEPDAELTYCATRGFGFTFPAFRRGLCIGFVTAESLGAYLELDAQPAELRAFAAGHNEEPGVLGTLALVAAQFAASKSARLTGRISTALEIEARANRLIAGLPAGARW